MKTKVKDMIKDRINVLILSVIFTRVIWYILETSLFIKIFLTVNTFIGLWALDDKLLDLNSRTIDRRIKIIDPRKPKSTLNITDGCLNGEGEE